MLDRRMSPELLDWNPPLFLPVLLSLFLTGQLSQTDFWGSKNSGKKLDALICYF